ncbi:MAG TPA: hypothetical protein VJ716_06565 [Gaiellaceae bacterium]|nr:hypothetical protein [Gaiellaceae bacterium]
MRPIVIKAAAQRVTGKQPSRMHAFFAALVTAGAAGVFAYKLLRSGGD